MFSASGFMNTRWPANPRADSYRTLVRRCGCRGTSRQRAKVWNEGWLHWAFLGQQAGLVMAWLPTGTRPSTMSSSLCASNEGMWLSLLVVSLQVTAWRRTAGGEAAWGDRGAWQGVQDGEARGDAANRVVHVIAVRTEGGGDESQGEKLRYGSPVQHCQWKGVLRLGGLLPQARQLLPARFREYRHCPPPAWLDHLSQAYAHDHRQVSAATLLFVCKLQRALMPVLFFVFPGDVGLLLSIRSRSWNLWLLSSSTG